jgi:hypothetical protein
MESGHATRSAYAPRTWLGAAALAVSGLLFVLYPAIRPFSDETSLQGAAAFASPAWLVAHLLAMVGFTLLALGLLGLQVALQRTPVERLTFWALVVSWLGIGFTLPFYGGEAFGLHAIGQEALRGQSLTVLSLASVVRSGPGLAMFLLGLLLLGIGTVMAAVAIWKSGTLPRWSGVPFALGFVLYIPQFFGTQPVRVAHGLLVAVGCVWIAVGMWRLLRRGKWPQASQVTH